MKRKNNLFYLLVLIGSFVFSILNEFLIRLVAIFYQNFFVKGDDYRNFFASIDDLIYGPLDSLGFIGLIILQSIIFTIFIVFIAKLLKSKINLLKIYFSSLFISISLCFFATPKYFYSLSNTINYRFFLKDWIIPMHVFLVFLLVVFLLKKYINILKNK